MSSRTEPGSTSLVLPRPTGVAAGDVLVAALSMTGNPSITVPSGWTLVQNQVSGSSLPPGRVRPGGRREREPAPTPGPSPPPQPWRASSPPTAASIRPSRSTSPAAASMRPPARSWRRLSRPARASLLVGFFGILTNATIAPPPGMLEQAEVATSGKNKLAIEAADQVLTGTGPTGTRTATADKAAVNVGQSIVLRPAGAAPAARRRGADSPDERRRHRGLADPGRPDLDGVLGQRRASITTTSSATAEPARSGRARSRASATRRPPDTTYSYTVVAVDAAGNASAARTSNSVTTPPTPPPPAPRSPSARPPTPPTRRARPSSSPGPPGRRPGDVLVASIDVLGAVTITPPAGWQESGSTSTGRPSPRRPTCASSEPASRDLSLDLLGACTASGGIHAYSGVDTTAPIAAAAGR